VRYLFIRLGRILAVWLAGVMVLSRLLVIPILAKLIIYSLSSSDRDGTSVLPTGRNIHALDPYRMPAEGAWIRGQQIAEETLSQHLKQNDGMYPETIACTLWGLDTIKTRGKTTFICDYLLSTFIS